MFQDTGLFNRTTRGNIRIGKPDAVAVDVQRVVFEPGVVVGICDFAGYPR